MMGHLPRYARLVLDAARKIRQPPEPITTNELVKATGYQRSTVNRAIRHLRVCDLWPWRRFTGRPGCRLVEPDDADSIEAASVLPHDTNVAPEHRPDIAAATAAIRAGWTDAQRAARECYPAKAWAVPGVGVGASVLRRWDDEFATTPAVVAGRGE